jgi:4-amino-4-deoxy-L-arabinose transferase-like glycosyltransferase
MIQENCEKQIRAVLALLLALLIMLIIILAAVPPVSRDALVHHLAVPKLWIAHGGIYEMPDKVFSYYPMTVDLLYLIPLYLGNDIVPKFIHFTFALATSLLIFNYLKRRLDGNYALLGALFFLSTPIILKLSITAYVDLGLVFFSTAALMCTFKWREKIPRLKYLILAALMGGLALGTKYNGLIIMLLLTLIVAFIASRGFAQGKQTAFKAVLAIMLFGTVAGLMYAPWGIKNFIWTGNPLYPLFDQWFNAADPYQTTSVPPFVLRKVLYEETWWEILLVPLRIFFQGLDNSPQYFDGKLNPALLMLPAFAFMANIGDKNRGQTTIEKGIMLAFSVLFISIVFFKTSMRARYIVPAIPCLVILSMFGLKTILSLMGRYFSRGSKRLITGLFLILPLVPFYFNTIYIIEQFKVVKPIHYLSGNISRDLYIEKFRPEYAAVKHANEHLPHDAEILALFIGNRGYYSERGMRYDVDLLQSAVERAASTQEMRNQLAAFGFTHLLIRFDMFDNWCNSFLNEKEKQIVRNFFQIKGILLFAKNGHGLYKL